MSGSTRSSSWRPAAAVAGVLALATGLLLAVPELAAAAPAECQGQVATIVGTPAADHLEGTPGEDVVWLGGADDGGVDVFVDPGGDDLVCQGGYGFATVQAGPGNDRVLMDSSPEISFPRGAVTVYGEGGDDLIEAGEAQVRQFGGPGDDVLVGRDRGGSPFYPDGEPLLGGPGQDTLRGLGGADWLDGGPDDDTLEAGAGDDWMTGSRGNDVADGGEGRDTLGFSYASGGEVTTYLTQGVSMDLTTGVVTTEDGTTLAEGTECWTGTPYADEVEGSPDPDCVDGGPGPDADVIRTGAGDDEIVIASGVADGGDGDDRFRLNGLGGADDPAIEAEGGPGGDRFFVANESVSVDSGDGDDSFRVFVTGGRLEGGAGADRLVGGITVRIDARRGELTSPFEGGTLHFAGMERYRGTYGDDHFRGSRRDEVFEGGNGDDTVVAGRGDDEMAGQGGDDDLRGGGGRDTARGGPGHDDCRAEVTRSC